MMKDTIPVRRGEELNVLVLEQFLRQQIPLPDSPLEIRQFRAGHSNLTYELKAGDWEAVLRRPPLGPVAPKAHDMKREFRILKELHPLFTLAPRPILFSDDESIVGSSFFIMERRHGVVLDTQFPEGTSVTPELCKKISETMVDMLVQLHSIDYKLTDLPKMTAPEGFLERQVFGWIQRFERAKTDEIREVELLTKWLVSHIPSSGVPTVIHYDYKLNNALFSKDDLTKIVGLFDWEMTTVGDPLADLGIAMGYWTEAKDPEELKTGLGKAPVTVYEGFLTRGEFIQLYAKKSGRDVSNMNFYLTFAYFKLAGICQQIYYRWKKGQTNDPRFSKFNQFAKALILQALEVSTEKH
jgi:aminoglycoside phosphotransferase (APT) family kinase protein